MSLKKKIVLASALAIISLPIASYANLDTNNYTNEDSAVKILSTGACSGDAGHFTPAAKGGTPGKNSETPLMVRLLCTGSANNTCKAVMYSSQHCTAGTEIANVSLNLSSLNVTVDSIVNQRYSVSAQGSTVSIRYAG